MRKSRLVIRPETLRLQRLRAVLSRQQLAQKAGVTRQRIDMLEAGHRPGIKPETARAIADALGCPVEDLVEVEEASA